MESPEYFFKAVQQLSDWKVLLDILFFTLIIYLLYRTLRATGTWQIVIGLTIAAVGAGLASLIGLRGVEWLYSNFSQVAMIALLVLFQPEIRKVLERTTSMLRTQSREETISLATLTGDVLFALSQKRCGAIIVLPGIDSLKQWTSEGVKVDALPSFSLLMSIFDTGSPGHDGAAIIENGRISSIAVRLPLSQANDLPEIMGTRHHASLGLSEKTDALIMTVSEERGTVSFFKKGKRTTVREPAEAVSLIMDHGLLSRNPAKELSIGKGRLLRTALEGGACFLIACLFWITVVMSKTQVGDMIFTVPVQYSNLQPDLVLEGKVPEQVKLHLEGPLSRLTTTDLSLLKVQVDLGSIGEGEQTVKLSEENVQVGKKIRIIEIIPSSIDLQVKTLERSYLQIEPQLIGSLPTGLQIKTIEVVPERVQVFMSPTDENQNSSPKSLRTTPVYLQGLYADTVLYGKIVSPPNVQPVESGWPDIEIRIRVEPAKQ